jgi:Fic family protein
MKPLDLDELQSTVETALKECGEAEIIRQFESLERSRRVDAQDLFSRSTDRLSRQTQLLQKIQTQSEKPNISALAREFKVARKTILRDLSELIRRGQLESSIMKSRE